ncbi:MAG TPA: hypothetical protein VMB71_06050, partial [Acetobacteraceae bacterium]|nr:hypothetical protein [Acetobacteraceae bacterium]
MLFAPLHALAAPPSAATLFAAEHKAVGGDTWQRVAGVRLDGVVTTGGAPGQFTVITDRARGWSRQDVHTGPQDSLSGFDGEPWVAQNGIVTTIDLPSLVSDAVTQAFAARD